MTEQKQHFIKTVQQGDNWVALFLDGTAHEAEVLRTAARMDTFNTIRQRGKVHHYTADQLQERAPQLKEQGLTADAAAYDRALVVLAQKGVVPATGVVREAPKAKAATMGASA